MTQKITADRTTALRLLYSVLVASALLPALLIGYLVWVDRQTTFATADERIARSLAVLNEHALKVFQSVELALQNVNELIGDFKDGEVAAREETLHGKLQSLKATLKVQSVWALAADGRPLVTSTRFPVPPNVAFQDRDYFLAHKQGNRGSFISQVLTPRITDEALFSMTRPRRTADNSFGGVVGASLLPSDFRAFYAQIAGTSGIYFAMIREDGTFLVRYPAIPQAAVAPQSPFLDLARRGVEAGVGTFPSQLDGRERRLGWRKIQGYPVFVLAGQEIGAIEREWLAHIRWYLVFGLPTQALVIGLVGLSIHRTRRLYAEAERRVAAETALRQSQRMEAIGQLTGGVAHDFNNLLMVMQGAVERLRRLSTDPKSARPLEMIATAVERAERLTNHLLAFSRQKTHVMETVDLRTHLSSIEDVLQRSLRGDIRIELSVAREPCIVLADLDELELAVLNVAVNARDAMPQGGTLSIDVRGRALHGTDNPAGLKGDFIAIRIADTGSGIPADVLPRVFEPFFTTKEVGKGTGLGLSQVYGFASQSGGTITIDTEPGRGTAVTILLPRVEALAAPQPQAKADDDAHPPGNATVLVVEDNQEVAEVCRSYLQQLGYRVVMADNAQAGLAIVRGGAAIDLVLTDIVMAGEMNGIDLARQLRSDHVKLPIILTTGYSTDVSLASNEFPLIRKPYSLAELRKRLDEALGRRG